MDFELKYKKKFDLVTSGLLKSSPATVNYLDNSYNSNTGTFKGMKGINKDCTLKLTYLWKGIQTKTQEYNLKLKKYTLTVNGSNEVWVGEKAYVTCSGGEPNTESIWTVTNGRIITNQNSFDNNGQSTIVVIPSSDTGVISCICNGCGVSSNTYNVKIRSFRTVITENQPWVRLNMTGSGYAAISSGGRITGVSIQGLPSGLTYTLSCSNWSLPPHHANHTLYWSGTLTYEIKRGNQVIAKGSRSYSNVGPTSTWITFAWPPAAFWDGYYRINLPLNPSDVVDYDTLVGRTETQVPDG
jgi:hypothetical protein